MECIKWGGQGLLYSASRDRTIKVWAVEDNLGVLVRTLSGHAHRINTLALNVDYACRSGPFDHNCKTFSSEEEGIDYITFLCVVIVLCSQRSRTEKIRRGSRWST